MRPLTDYQANVLRYIIEFVVEHMYQPSWREIAFGLDMDSVNEVTCFVDSLIKKGYLEKHEERRTPRVLEIQDKALCWYAYEDLQGKSKYKKVVQEIRRANAFSS